MRRTLPLTAVVLFLAFAPGAALAGPAGTRLFRHESFTVSLPAGWKVAEQRPGPKGWRYVPARKPQAATRARVVHFADARGNYFTVSVDRATDLEVDAVWTVHRSSDGASVEIGAEGPPCQGGGTTSGPCTAGNGTFEAGTLPAVRVGAHSYTFAFGNTAREQGVDLAPFRWILQSFQAR
jgi:hypothetical protein